MGAPPRAFLFAMPEPLPATPSVHGARRPTILVQRPMALIQRIGPAGLALAVGVVALAFGLRGTDVASQAYRVNVLRLHGFVLWDNGWYGGSLPPGYSVLSPVLGVALGVGGATLVCAVVAAWCFDRVVLRVAGRRLIGSWYFAASTLLSVAIGQLPYLSGEAVALAAVLALLRGRPRLGVALGMLSALFSPLAAAFLILVCAVWAVHRGVHRRSMLVTAATAGAMVIAIGALFPGDGPFPFDWTGLVLVELLCGVVLSPLVRTTPVVRLAAAVYGLATLGSFIVPNPLGGNATRLAESIGVPLVACLMMMPAPDVVGATRRPLLALPRLVARGLASRRAGLRRPALALGILLPFAVWQWAPGMGLIGGASASPSNRAAFYQPLLGELASLDHGQPIRVEIVPTLDHWESADVGPYVSLARGWERQLDVGDNPIFYTAGALNPRSYRSWLDNNGVSYVALPNAPLDYAAVAEAGVLRAGHVSGLRPVWTTATWRVWRVVGSPGLVTGPARITTLAPDRLGLDVRHAGDVLVRVRYTGYWHLDAGAACVQPAPGGWTEVHAARAGPVQFAAALVGADGADCPTP